MVGDVVDAEGAGTRWGCLKVFKSRKSDNKTQNPTTDKHNLQCRNYIPTANANGEARDDVIREVEGAEGEGGVEEVVSQA